MKINTFKKMLFFTILITATTVILAGCGEPSEIDDVSLSVPSTGETVANNGTASNSQGAIATELYVQFGDDGAPFAMHLYDNETSAAIAGHVGTADWRIPLYNYEDYENWEIMQYYDIPSRYEIPSNPESVTTQQAGTVYYSDPNRIVLFYGDGQISAEYTPVGYFDVTPEFVSAVENNPVLEGWSNKIIKISARE